MSNASHLLDDRAFDTLFRDARSFNHWQDKPVDEADLRALYDLVKMGPTSANSSPARFVFISTPEAKQRLKPHLNPGNVEKTMTAPVTVIIANDKEFYEHMPKLFPHTDAKSWFAGKPDYIDYTAAQSGTLQGGYLIMAARSLGLDCGPMNGFDAQGVKQAFFPDRNWEANFLVNLGYGDDKGMFPRLPRFDFDEVCEIL